MLKTTLTGSDRLPVFIDTGSGVSVLEGALVDYRVFASDCHGEGS